jgi:hypothetical protein
VTPLNQTETIVIRKVLRVNDQKLFMKITLTSERTLVTISNSAQIFLNPLGALPGTASGTMLRDRDPGTAKGSHVKASGFRCNLHDDMRGMP